jgi:hypothetical protein
MNIKYNIQWVVIYTTDPKKLYCCHVKMRKVNEESYLNMSIILSTEQLEFLKKHNFYFYDIREDITFPYVSGIIGRNYPEFYNTSSIEKLIDEIKQFGKPLEDKNAIQFQSVQHDCFGISQDRLRFIDLHKNRETGELEVESPIRKAFHPQLKSILEETEDYYTVVSRYRGETGDASQFTERVYKSLKAAQRGCVVMLESHRKKKLEQIGYLDTLIEQYKGTIVEDC